MNFLLEAHAIPRKKANNPQWSQAPMLKITVNKRIATS